MASSTTVSVYARKMLIFYQVKEEAGTRVLDGTQRLSSEKDQSWSKCQYKLRNFFGSI